METRKFDYGMIGLGTMGRNLVCNIADHGYSVAGFDKDKSMVEALEREAKPGKIFCTHSLEAFLNALKSPKTIILLVPSGVIVDDVINELKPSLHKDDLVLDCGNSHYTDTDRRISQLENEHIHFMGIGVSGGEYGAKYGPSIMPGGDPEAYALIAPMLEAVAAKADGRPCVSWMGPGSAGHYVKMVHNGIEYGLMQLIAEAYHLLKGSINISNDKLHDVFLKWNSGILKSFLIEITAYIFKQKDDITSYQLIDMILDKAGQKGTGQWASQSAMDMGVPIPGIDTAVSARDLSALKDERIIAQQRFDWFKPEFMNNNSELIDWLEHALYFSMISVYAQGMCLLQAASKQHNYNLNLKEIAGIWQGGCIIRASLLKDIYLAFEGEPEIKNIMLSSTLTHNMEAFQNDTRLVVKTAIDMGIPMPAMMTSLAYFDSYRSGWLPANLLQAQRDYFGAHHYERIDRKGSFHTLWDQK